MLVKLGGLFFIVSLIFWLWAIFDSITSDDQRIRLLPKAVWVIIVLLFLEVGALAWVLLGRPRADQRQGPRNGFPPMSGGPRGTRGSRGSQRSAGPVGPDDDPDFLRGI
jgi:hypothetical protein